MTPTRKPTGCLAQVIAVAVEIRCPCCDREDPIPARDGSFMWEGVPETVTCPDCGAVSRVSRRITSG
jgi:rubredoxin